MGNWIFLPDGRLVLINGIGKGTAGYGNTSWAIGQSFGDDPVRSCVPLPSSSPGLPLTSFTLQDSLLRCQRADGLALLERHRREHRRQDVPLRRHAPPRRLGLLEWVEPQRRLRPYRNSWIQVPYRVPVRLAFPGSRMSLTSSLGTVSRSSTPTTLPPLVPSLLESLRRSPTAATTLTSSYRPQTWATSRTSTTRSSRSSALASRLTL